MDCCGFTVSSLKMEALLSLSVGVIISLVAYYWIYRQKDFKYSNQKAPSASSSTCSSPNCVRCNEGVIERKIKTAVEQFHIHEANLKVTERIKQGILNREALINELMDTNSLQQPNVLYIPGLGTGPLLQRNVYKSDMEFLEGRYEEFVNEFRNVFQTTDGWTVNTVSTGQWSVFYLINQGNYVADNCQRCPKTTAFIYKVKNLMSDCVFGNVGFSVVTPGTYITEHFGPTNARVRCHLGLLVPDNCELFVGNTVVSWKEGKCILFDDSFLHSVHHGGDLSGASRVVLLVDMWHPSLTDGEKRLLQQCYASNSSEQKDCVTD